MHVGDSVASDVAGANAIGAVSVWLNRDVRQNDLGITPDYEIQSLAELPDIVQNHPETSSRSAEATPDSAAGM
jgi:putative hydrolase of the HAD superfamily